MPLFTFTVNNVNLLPYIQEDGLKWTRFDVERRTPSHAFALYPLPAAAAGRLIPPAALQSESRPSLDGLADAIVSAISSLQSDSPEPVIRVYLDGKQISDAVTKDQRRDARAQG